ncbi:MAG: serine hydrolase [Gaiellaceae bacterium]
MIDAPALPPPAVLAPAPREVSFGLVAGSVPRGTRRIIVRVGEQVLADRTLRGRTFSLRVELPGSIVPLRVTAVDSRGRRSWAVVPGVRGLPAGSEPRAAAPRLDPVLGRTVRRLTAGAGGTSGVYVQDLRTGRGAAWNAAARFPAASTLKLAIAVAVLRSLEGKPVAGSRVDALLREMLIRSDNASANALEVWLAGSTTSGSVRVDETLRALGLNDSLMYGGYEITRRPAVAATPIPIRVESQPAFGVGKYTTAADLARLARSVYLAGAGKGPLLSLGVSGSEARYLLWLLAQVTDLGKLDRFLGARAFVLHKAGWLPNARHDNGIVVSAGGVFVASVMTWGTGGGDELAGRVALAALERFGAG